MTANNLTEEKSERQGNPTAAAILSIVPGLGQIYCGAWTRGLGWLLGIFGQIGLLWASETARPLIPWVGVFWLWNISDAWFIAVGRPKGFTAPVLFAAVLNFVAGWQLTQVDIASLVTGLPSTQNIVVGLATPDLWQDGKLSATFSLNLKLIVETVYMALIGTVLPIPVTLVLSVLGARNLMGGHWATKSIYGVSRSVMNLLRSVEVIVIAFMMAKAVGIGPFAGVLAVAIHGIGAQGKLYSEAIEDTDIGPVEAIKATGATWLQTVLYGIIPQVTPQFIAFTMYRWDINVRMATIIGLVGGGGIGYTLYQYINTLQWRQAGTAIWMIAVVVILMDWASAAVREKFA